MSLRTLTDDYLLPVMFLSSPVSGQHGAAVVVVAAVVAEAGKYSFPLRNARLKAELSSCCSSKLRLHCTQDCLVFVDTEVAEAAAVESAGGTYLKPRIQPFIGCNTSVITSSIVFIVTVRLPM